MMKAIVNLKIFEDMRRYKMNEKEMSGILKHYCDAILKYDFEKQQFYVCYDKQFPERENKWYSREELEALHKGTHMYEPDEETAEKNFSLDALMKFRSSDEDCRSFEFRVGFKKLGIYRYEVIMQKTDDSEIIISYRNTHEEIFETALGKAISNAFDGVVYIDTQDGMCMIRNKDGEYKADYAETVSEYIKKYVAEEETERVENETKLSFVVERLKNQQSYSSYATVYSPNGGEVYKKLSFAYVGEGNRIIAMIASDVSDIVNKYSRRIKRYKKESYRDVLTKAYNRKYYEEKLKLKNIAVAGVAMVDIDDFKLCNDIYGHSAGDEVLGRIAETVRSSLEAIDVMVKYGGDEFLLIMPGVTRGEELKEKLERIRRSVDSMTFEEISDIKISISLGGTIARDEAVYEAANRADRLMYIEKSRKNMSVTEEDALKECDGAEKAVKQKVLIVDDSEINRSILANMLKEEFSIITANGGKDCVDKLQQYGTGISLVLLDIIMPETDGFEVLQYMNENGLIENIPVVLISCEKTGSMIKRAYEMGASDYISRPFDVEVVRKRVFNIIKVNMRQRRMTALISRQIYERERNNRVMVDILSRIVEFRNADSGSHVINIQHVTKIILDELMRITNKYKITWEEKNLITVASSLHDVGKISIDEKILNKPGKLTKEEFEIMKTHTTNGEAILKSIPEYSSEKIIRIAAEVCTWHHERYDGGGYPDGISGDDIPISAQIVSIADVYDALVSDRVYKKAIPHDEAIRMICSGECGAFNPILLTCLENVRNSLGKQLRTH